MTNMTKYNMMTCIFQCPVNNVILFSIYFIVFYFTCADSCCCVWEGIHSYVDGFRAAVYGELLR